jgi:hypothetical protein
MSNYNNNNSNTCGNQDCHSCESCISSNSAQSSCPEHHSSLSPEQRQFIASLEGFNITTIDGYAGTGKSNMSEELICNV